LQLFAKLLRPSHVTAQQIHGTQSPNRWE